MNLRSYRKQNELMNIAYGNESENKNYVSLLNKFQGWVQLEPGVYHKKINKIKAKESEENKKSNFRPAWMANSQLNKYFAENGNKGKNDLFKAVPFLAIKGKNSNPKDKKQQGSKMNDVKTMWLVDKANLEHPEKSVFSFMDYRLDAMNEKDVKEYNKGLSMKPKAFFV